MRQRLNAPGLERLAEAILREHPLPDDPKARSYEQRMALKALSIAAYDRELGAAGMAEEIELFTALYGEEVTKRGGWDDKVRIAALNGVLAIDIRVGAWDEAPPALIALLMAQVRARLAQSNPRYLKATLGE
jgi:hypothetical protein